MAIIIRGKTVFGPKPSPPAYGTLTTAWIAATGETDLTILGALNTLETDLTTYGLTAKMKALYPFVGGTAGKHSYNFMNTAAYQLTFNGGWTHSSTGALPGGVNSYANTGLTPNAVLSQNSTHISVYSRTNIGNVGVDIGSQDVGSTKGLYMLPFFNATFFYSRLNSAAQVNYSPMPNSLGLLSISRIVSNQYSLYKNGTNLITGSANSDGLSPFNISLSALNDNGSNNLYSSRQLAIASIGDGLDDTEAANFYTAVQAFQTTLSRNV